MKKILFIFVILLLGSVIAVWLNASRLALPLLEQKLHDLGFETVRIEALKISPDGAHIGSVVLTQGDNRLFASGVTVSWQGEAPEWINSIHIDKIKIRISSNIELQTTAGKGALPAITIDQMQIDTALNDIALSFAVKEISFKNNKIQAQLSMKSKNLSGEGSLKGSFSGADAYDLELDLSQISAAFNNITVNDMTASLRVRPQMQISGNLNIGKLDLGRFPLKNGAALLGYQGDKKLLRVENMRWNFAGGKITSPAFTFDLRTRSADIVLKLHNLDLSRLLQTLQVQGLSASGRVDGEVPIHIENGNIHIGAARLNASETGIIRYDPKNPPKFLQTGNEYMGMVREALKNYHYKILSLTISPGLDDNQTVSIKARGSNPAFYDGRPVELNLNIEGELENILRFNLGTYALPERIKEQMEQSGKKP